MNDTYYLKETSQKNLVCASGADSFVRLYGETIRRIEARCGADVVSLFAEPVLPSNADPENPKLSWYTSVDGRAIELGSIDEAARGPIVARLRSRLEKLKPILEDPEIGSRVASWLYVPSPHSIFAVGGAPVLIDWGFVPAAIANSKADREAHFNATIGRYAPDLMLPPFTREEQDVYAAQLSARNSPPSQTTARLRQVSPERQAPQTVTSVTSGATAASGAADAVALRSNWKAPLIAALIAAGVLVFLAWPGVLVKPKAVDVASIESDEKALRDGNQALEEKLRQLRDQSRDKVCRAPDQKPPQLVPVGPDGKPIPRQAPIPPPIDKVDITPPGQTSPVPLETFFEQTVVNIGGPVDAQHSVTGSGFFINPTQVVTNRHVVERIKEGQIVLTNKSMGGAVPAKIVAISDSDPQEEAAGMSHADLAVLEVAPSDHPYMSIGPSPAKMQDVFAIGYPGYLHSTDMTIQRGIVTTKPDYTVPTIVHSAQIAPGNSGGPLTDLCGRVVGVNTVIFKDRGQPIVGFAAQDVSVLAAFLSEHQIKSFKDEGANCAAQVRADPPADRQVAQKPSK